MNMMRRIPLIVLLLLMVTVSRISAQQRMIIDKIVAIVGESTILESDVQMQYVQMRRQGMISAGKASRCRILEDIMVQKLLYHQSKLDSLPLDPGEVERQLDARLEVFVKQIGSQEALEKFYHKSFLEIKDDFRDDVREQVLAGKEQGNIIQDVTMTPGEVKSFYKKLPKDSIPVIPEQYEIQQIQINPPYSAEAKIAARQKLLDLRKRIIEGERFSTLAILYSEDPGSARRGGELGYTGKAELDKDFARVAFSLRKGQVSPIVETRFGYHIIQLIDRKGDMINVRHILIKPKLSADAIRRANTLLDSIARQIRIDSLSFRKAAFLYSEDKETRTTGGLVRTCIKAQT
jgi:peptidyl-prolyl cis-trans isomerase SurA